MGNGRNNIDFEDITEPFEFVYSKEQEIGGVIYTHIYGGVYKPAVPVRLEPDEFEKLLEKYNDLVFHVKRPECIIYLVNSRGMAQYDQLISNMLRRRKEFEDICGSVDVNELEDVCWQDKNYGKNSVAGKSGLCWFRPVDKNNRYEGYLKHIQIGNKIGYLIEPGIYYFGEPEGDERLWKRGLIMSTLQSFENEIAVIGYSTDFHPSFEIAVEYLAKGKQNFARLKEIQNTKNNSFFFEFSTKPVDMDPIDIEQVVPQDKKMESKEIEKLEIEPEAEEVLEGVGFRKVKLGYHMMFSNQKPVKEYQMAYVLNGKLILIDLDCEDGEGWNRKEIDMRLLGELTVRVELRLNCGLRMERDIKVIDCKEEKMQEFLENSK